MTTTHRQHPLGTRFTAASTTDDILDGIDLTGMVAVVTAGHSGLGLETTRSLSRAGASVTVGARNVDRARANIDGLDRVWVERLDLLDPASIEEFAQRQLARGVPLHALVNSAAAPTPGTVLRDRRGYEVQFATSHLGHFQLSRALHPALQDAGRARVVNVTSGAHRLGGMRWHDPHFSTGYTPVAAYAQAKTANVLFAVGLDRHWSDNGIRGYAVHPGVVVGTTFNDGADVASLQAMGLMDQAGRPVIDPAAGKKTIPQGASTIVFAATSPQLADVGGVYLKDNDVAPLDDRDLPVTVDFIPSDAAPHAIDPDAAERLWLLSEQLLTAR